jgi:hypothetical protein
LAGFIAPSTASAADVVGDVLTTLDPEPAAGVVVDVLVPVLLLLLHAAASTATNSAPTIDDLLRTPLILTSWKSDLTNTHAVLDQTDDSCDARL